MMPASSAAQSRALEQHRNGVLVLSARRAVGTEGDAAFDAQAREVARGVAVDVSAAGGQPFEESLPVPARRAVGLERFVPHAVRGDAVRPEELCRARPRRDVRKGHHVPDPPVASPDA